MAVVGAGPAGAATALLLARAGLTVALVDAAAGPDARLGESVPGDVRPLLAELGVWEAFAAGPHLPSAGACSAWGGARLDYRDALLEPRGGGWQLDRACFDGLLRAAAVRAGARPWRSTRVVALERRGRGFRLELRRDGRGHALEARFVVDAAGRRGPIARQVGARPIVLDRLIGVQAVFSFAAGRAPAGRHTLVEAAPDGWWYAARVPGERSVACFFTDSDLARQAGLTRPAEWRARLARTRHARVYAGAADGGWRLRVAWAASQRLEPAAGEGWLAVGDAASACDPLASAGLMLALRTATEAAAALLRSLDGDGAALRAYAAGVRRRFELYLAGRREQYAREARWPASPFWRRRAGLPAAAGRRTA